MTFPYKIYLNIFVKNHNSMQEMEKLLSITDMFRLISYATPLRIQQFLYHSNRGDIDIYKRPKTKFGNCILINGIHLTLIIMNSKINQQKIWKKCQRNIYIINKISNLYKSAAKCLCLETAGKRYLQTRKSIRLPFEKKWDQWNTIQRSFDL